MTTNTTPLTDEVTKRLDDLNRDLDTLTEGFARQDEESRREGEQNLTELEALNLDAELEPIEEEAIQELEGQLAEALKATDDEATELDRLEEEDRKDEAADEELPTESVG